MPDGNGFEPQQFVQNGADFNAQSQDLTADEQLRLQREGNQRRQMQGQGQYGNDYFGVGMQTVNEQVTQKIAMVVPGFDYYNFSESDVQAAKDYIGGVQSTAFRSYLDEDGAKQYFPSIQNQMATNICRPLTDKSGFGNTQFGNFNRDQLNVIDRHATDIIRNNGKLGFTELSNVERETMQPIFSAAGNDKLYQFTSGQQSILTDHLDWQRNQASNSVYNQQLSQRFTNIWSGASNRSVTNIIRSHNGVSPAVQEYVKRRCEITGKSATAAALAKGDFSVTEEMRKQGLSELSEKDKTELASLIRDEAFSNKDDAAVLTKAASVAAKNEGMDVASGMTLQHQSAHMMRAAARRRYIEKTQQGPNNAAGNEYVRQARKLRAARLTGESLTESADTIAIKETEKELTTIRKRVESGHAVQGDNDRIRNLEAKLKNQKETADARRKMHSARRNGKLFSDGESADGFFDSKNRLKDLKNEKKNIKKSAKHAKTVGRSKGDLDKAAKISNSKAARDTRKARNVARHITNRKEAAAQAVGRRVQAQRNALSATASKWQAKAANSALAKALSKSRLAKAAKAVAEAAKKAAQAIADALAPILLVVIIIIIILCMVLFMGALFVTIMQAVMLGGSPSDSSKKDADGNYPKYYQEIVDNVQDFQRTYIRDRQNKADELAKGLDLTGKDAKFARPGTKAKVENAKIRSIINEYGQSCTDISTTTQLLYMGKYRILDVLADADTEKDDLNQKDVERLSNYMTAMWIGQKNNQTVANLANPYNGNANIGYNHQMIVNTNTDSYLQGVQADGEHATFHNGGLKDTSTGDEYSYSVMNHGSAATGAVTPSEVDGCDNLWYYGADGKTLTQTQTQNKYVIETYDPGCGTNSVQGVNPNTVDNSEILDHTWEDIIGDKTVTDQTPVYGTTTVSKSVTNPITYKSGVINITGRITNLGNGITLTLNSTSGLKVHGYVVYTRSDTHETVLKAIESISGKKIKVHDITALDLPNITDHQEYVSSRAKQSGKILYYVPSTVSQTQTVEDKSNVTGYTTESHVEHNVKIGTRETVTWDDIGHCGGHITPYMDLWYVSDIKNLCKSDTFPQDKSTKVELSQTEQSWVGQQLQNLRALITKGSEDQVNPSTVTVSFGKNNSNFKKWGDDEIAEVETFAGTQDTNYQDGIELAKQNGINIQQGYSNAALTSDEVTASLADIQNTFKDIDASDLDVNRRTAAIQYAQDHVLQCRYLFGGTQEVWCDCSAFVSHCYGISRHTTAAFSNYSNRISNIHQLYPGTIVLRYGPDKNGKLGWRHTAIVENVDYDAGTVTIISQSGPDKGDIGPTRVTHSFNGFFDTTGVSAAKYTHYVQPEFVK